MINIQNESSLHNTLKLFYASITEGKTEIKEDGHIYDIVTKDGRILEIQTKNLSSLSQKIKDVIQKNKKITIVYPLVIKTEIYLTDENGDLISKRTSPKKGNIYDVLKELTGIYPFLLLKNFNLKIVKINMIEHRLKTTNEVQSQNKKRRFKKDWIKINKRLNEILSETTFSSKQDYLSFLPKGLKKEFCAKDIKEILKNDKTIPSRVYNNTNLIIWILKKMDLIEQTKIEKRNHYYKIK